MFNSAYLEQTSSSGGGRACIAAHECSWRIGQLMLTLASCSDTTITLQEVAMVGVWLDLSAVDEKME